jgi:hypothetical protein
MSVKNSQLADLLATTLKDLPDGDFEVMWDSQHFEAAAIMESARRKIDGGTSIQRNMILDRNGRAKFRRLFDTDSPAVDQVMTTIDVPWTQVSVDYSWDKVEIMRNKNSAKGFIDLLRGRRTERLWDFAELIEERMWLTPTSSSDDLYPNGIPYYINYLDNGVSAAGFSGKTIRYQDGTTGTTCAGVDASAKAKWRNYAATYTTVDNSLLRELRSAVRRTRFKPPSYVPKPGMDGVGSPVKFYANDQIVTELEDLGDQRDDNTQPKDLAGKMLHNYEGTVYFNRMPIVYIPQLDGVTVTDGGSNSFSPDPIYCIDWSKLQPFVQDGYWMVESEPMTDRGQHTTFTVFLDGSFNFLCVNRRTAGFVLHKTIPAS